MIPEIFLFALLQVVCGLSIERPSRELDMSAAPIQRRELATGSKVAIGICIPGAALVVGLGLGIMCLYPRQLRKLRKQNPGAEIGLRELMEGRVTRPAAPRSEAAPQPEVAPQSEAAPHSEAAPPPYEERQGAPAVATKDGR